MNPVLRTGIFAAWLAFCGAASASIITTDPNLPPSMGAYRTPADVHAEYIGPGLDIVLSDVLHFAFINVVRIPAGPNELETFDSTVTGNVSINANPQFPVILTGPVETEVFGKTGNTTGTFPTEMLQLDLMGGGIMVRESPTLASTGQTTITDIGGGLFKIDSFFDVFTELSLDGGLTWMPSTGPARVDLVPEPATLALFGLGLAGLGFGRRKLESGQKTLEQAKQKIGHRATGTAICCFGDRSRGAGNGRSIPLAGFRRGLAPR